MIENGDLPVGFTMELAQANLLTSIARK